MPSAQRIPILLEEQGISLPPAPGPPNAAALAAPAQAIERLGTQVSSAAFGYLEASQAEARKLEDRKAQIAAAHKAAEITTQYTLDLEDLDTRLKREPDPQNHAAIFQGEAAKLRQRAIGAAGQDAAVADFVVKSTETIFRDRAINARREGDRLFVDDKQASRFTRLQQLMRLAAGADNTRAYGTYAGIAYGLISADIQGGIITKEAGEREHLKWRQEVAEATALRDMEADPYGASDRLKGVGPNRVYEALQPDMKARLSEQAMRRGEHQDARVEQAMNRARAELDRANKDQAEEAERRIGARMRSGQLSHEEIDTYAPLLQSEKADQYHVLLDKNAIEGGPGDPATIKALETEVYSIAAATKASQLETRILKARLADQIPRSISNRLMEHVQVLAAKKKEEEKDPAKEFLGRQHAQVEQLIRQSLKTTGGLSLDFDGHTEEVISQAMQDLTMASAYLGKGEENPIEWWNRKRAYYTARVADRATTRISVLQGQLDPRFKDAAALRDAGSAAYGNDMAAWREQVRLQLELAALRREQARLRLSGGGGGTTPPSPSGAGGGTGGGGNRLGR